MSMEALSALRQLVQVRDQGESIQNENLEKVQDNVQQVSVAEAQKTDQLHLEKAKAQYEVALAQATVERLQSQEARDAKAVTFAKISTVMTIGLAVADAGMNLAKDFKGGQKLKDARLKDGRPEDAVTAIGAGNARTVGNSFDSNSVYVTGDSDKNGSQTVLRATIGGKIGEDGKEQPGNDQVKYMSAATITKDQILKKADKYKESFESNEEVSFEALYEKNPKAAEELFNEKGHDIMGVESKGAIEAFDAATKNAADKVVNTKDNDNNEVDLKTGAKNRATILSKSLEDKMEAEGKSNMGISGKDGAKYVWNALVSVADTVVPQIQALMAAKDRLEQIRIELAAAFEKLAAAEKKLKQIEELITTAGGGDGLGTGNNQAEMGLS